MSVWTDETTERLLRLDAAGDLSCSQMADALGPGFTRNMVIGKLARLDGLGKRLRRRRTAAAAPARRQPLPEPAPAPVPAQPAPPDPPAPIVVAPLTGVRIDELRDTHCRFIEGEIGSPETTLYCGERTILGASWCPAHSARVWSPASERRWRA